jgi:hypothetical protein
VENGPHELDLIGIDVYDWPTVLSIPVTVENSCPDTADPTVSITNPDPGTVSGTVEIEADASDVGGSGVTEVRFLVDDAERASDSSAPYSFWWNTTIVENGPHSLKAVAEDGCTNEGTSQVVNVTAQNGGGGGNDPPHLWVDEPPHLATVSGPAVRILGWATDDGGIPRTGSVTFELDGQGLPVSALTWYPRQDACSAHPVGDPFCPNVGWWVTFDSTLKSNGQHVVEVTANDGVAASTFQRTFYINNVPNPPPSLHIDWPTEDQTVSGTVWLDGWAIDDDSVVGLAYELDNQPLQLIASTTWHNRAGVCSGSGTNDPRCPDVGWRAAFDSGTHPDGQHSLRVTATDGRGGISSYLRHLVISNSASGVTRTFVPSDDTYSKQDYPDSNYGGYPHLSFRGGSSGFVRYVYLKFNVTNVTGPVQSAKLLIHESYGRDIPVLRVWRVFNTTWQEFGLTWNNAPYNAELITVVFDLEAGQTHEIDVTNIVTGSGVLTIALSTPEDEYLFVASREASASYRPTLRVTHQP